jgi:transposase
MRRKRRNHSPVYKAKVAVAAIKGDRTLVELSEQYDVHANQIQDWRKRLLDDAETVFGKGQQQREETDEKVKDLHAKIGQLTMERDFLEHGLERIHGPNGKK